eukprot:437598-Rhodomonas_salina.1
MGAHQHSNFDICESLACYPSATSTPVVLLLVVLRLVVFAGVQPKYIVPAGLQLYPVGGQDSSAAQPR